MGRGTENIQGEVERPKLLVLPLSEGLGSAALDVPRRRASQGLAISCGPTRRLPRRAALAAVAWRVFKPPPISDGRCDAGCDGPTN